MAKDGVSYYVRAWATVPVHFPEGHVCCQYCTWLRKGNVRCECRLTDEVLVDLKAMGYRCPAVFEEDPFENAD